MASNSRVLRLNEGRTGVAGLEAWEAEKGGDLSTRRVRSQIVCRYFRFLKGAENSHADTSRHSLLLMERVHVRPPPTPLCHCSCLRPTAERIKAPERRMTTCTLNKRLAWVIGIAQQVKDHLCELFGRHLTSFYLQHGVTVRVLVLCAMSIKTTWLRFKKRSWNCIWV